METMTKTVILSAEGLSVPSGEPPGQCQHFEEMLLCGMKSTIRRGFSDFRGQIATESSVEKRCQFR